MYRYKYHLTDDEIEKVKLISENVKRELEPLVLGRKIKGSQCCCGAIKVEDGEAISIRGFSPQYPSHCISWVLWTVNIQTPNNQGWSTGLSAFVDTETLTKIFSEHFVEFVY